MRLSKVLSFTMLLLTLPPIPLLGFDTAWHFQMTQSVATKYNLSLYSTRLLLLGSWAPDFYTILQLHLYEKIEAYQKDKKLALIPGLPYFFEQVYNNKEANAKIREIAIYMHFDNIEYQLDTNAKFHILIAKLLQNTTAYIKAVHLDSSLPQNTKNYLVLFALGSSLHMVQDFYAHTNWIHAKFKSFGLNIRDNRRTATYDEAVQFFGCDQADVPQFPFCIESGVYPDYDDAPLNSEDVPLTHFCMNHDNSRLGASHESDIPSLAQYHHCDDTVSHHRVAVETGRQASLEWVAKLLTTPEVKEAFYLARRIKRNQLFLHDFTIHAVNAIVRASVFVNKWDGAFPVESEVRVCKKMQLSILGMVNTVRSGSLEYLPNPFNPAWELFNQCQIIENIAGNLGSRDRPQYDFAPAKFQPRVVSPGTIHELHLTHAPATPSPPTTDKTTDEQEQRWFLVGWLLGFFWISTVPYYRRL